MSFKKLYFIFCILAACNLNNKNILKVGTSPDYPNLEFIKNGNLVGFEIDLLNEIGKRLDKKVEFKTCAFSNLLMELNNKNIDVIASGLSKTKERENAINFSCPIYQDELCLLSKIKLNNIKDLLNKKFGAQLGSRMEQSVKVLEKFLPIKLLVLQNNNQLVKELNISNIDFVILEKTSSKKFLENNKDLFIYSLDNVISQIINNAVLAKALSSLKESSKICFGFRKEDTILMEQVDKIILELTNEGFIKKLIEKWM